MSDMENKISGQWSVVSGRGAEKGFSLIEVVMIVAIVGILTTIAVLNFGGIIDSYKVRGAASQLYSEMQMARLKAIKEGKEWAVEFSGNTYCVKNQINTALIPPSADGWASGCSTTNDTILKTISLDSDYPGITATSSGSGGLSSGREVFYPNGTASSGISNPTWAKVTISKGSRIQSVCIRSTTGNIRVVSGASCS